MIFFFSEIKTLYINSIVASTVIFFGLDFDRHAESDFFLLALLLSPVE